MAILEKWSLVKTEGGKPAALRGEIRGDERFSDGTPITSSRLIYLDPDGHFACTKNGSYELGTMSDAFARWMATAGRTLADYANALAGSDPSQRKARLTPVAARPSRVVASIAKTPLLNRSVATLLVQTPTVVAP